MQQLAHRHSQKIIDENQNLRSELESKISELNARSKQFDDLSEKSDYEGRDQEQEKQKVCGLLASCISSFAPFLHLLNWSPVAPLIPTCSGERSWVQVGPSHFGIPGKAGALSIWHLGVFCASAN
jgi:hypothetical protein